jgi:hypothetical protein
MASAEARSNRSRITCKRHKERRKGVIEMGVRKLMMAVH